MAKREYSRPKRGLNRDDAVYYVGVSHSAFDQMVTDHRLPPPMELEGEEVWDMTLLDRAIDRLSGVRRNPF
jgi:predicted DNA-binding transcriptional regulator AlpA